ncbi:MAG: hypothetical protein ABSB82_06275 [Terriglobia bacterium]|jgi:hypothetical protein
MQAMKDFNWVQEDLTSRFQCGLLRKPVSLVAIIFCRPESELATGEILPSIDYYDQRGNNTVFYFAGYDAESVKAAHSDVKGPGNETWYFEAGAFNNFREEVERRTTWRYSGGTDMILTNARCDQFEGHLQGRVDFHTAIVLRLDKLKEISTVPTVSELFEKIFQYAEMQDTTATDPAWDFSNKAGVGLAKSALKSLILSFLPKALQDDAKGAFQLVAANIARPQAVF